MHKEFWESFPNYTVFIWKFKTGECFTPVEGGEDTGALKTPENLWFSDIFKGCRSETLV